MPSKLVLIGLLIVLLFGTGFWLARLPRPYPLGLFTLHKLAAVGIVILLGMQAAGLLRGAPIVSAPWAAAAVLLVLLATMATGGLTSLEKEAPVAVQKAHQLLPYLSVAAIAAYLSPLLR